MYNDFTVAVVGLGLIGGSLLKALRPKKVRLIGVSRSQETVKKAVELNLVDEFSTDFNILKSADIVFICTPINKTIQTIDKVRKIVRPNCIITDVASLKGFVIDYVNNNEFPTNFIGGHPMAGTEYQGIDNAAEDLFVGAKWVLTPSRWTDSHDIAKLEEIINYIGAKTIIADAHEHDKAVALISHMPLLLSQALFGFVDKYPDTNICDLALKLASSGFRDTTRLAGTNAELAIDMLSQNKINIRESIIELKTYLSRLEESLDSNRDEFAQNISQIAEKRRQMYSSDGKNIL